MLKANYWCWTKVQNPEESALQIAQSFVRYLSKISRSVLRMLDMNIRDFVCAGEDKGIILRDVNGL